jgi:nucleoside-diphosphate-sugar epimerase
MSNARNVLVTGAGGFVGRRVAQVLSRSGWQVTGLGRGPAPANVEVSRWWQADLLDEAAQLPPERFGAVVHLAGLLPGRASRRDLFAVNVGGTSVLLDHYGDDCSQVVLFSTGLVYGDQPGPFTEEHPCRGRDAYAQSKLAAEALVNAWARATKGVATVLRPSVLYGSGASSAMLLSSLFESLRQGRAFPMTPGEQMRDFLDVDDAATAVRLVLERRAGGTFNLGSGEPHTVRAAAELGAAIAGRPDLLRPGALPYRAHEVFDYRLVPTALRLAVDWNPRGSLEAGLRRMWEERA